jgi:hypothetical protein
MANLHYYNLFITAAKGAWNDGTYTLERSRFLEYTDGELAERFRALSPTQLDVLKSLPCLFAYEGRGEPMLLGRLKDIQVNAGLVTIAFELDAQTPSFPYERLAPLHAALGIVRNEIYRTHWAVKACDLMGTLDRSGLLPTQHRYNDPVVANLPDAVLIPPDDYQPATISSVSEFTSTVLARRDGQQAVFFRGHVNQTFSLTPSLFRKDGYLASEEQLFRELLIANPTDFQDDRSTLDRLVRAQHYGLPTRLLDITSNPLIALFFACHDPSKPETGHDGVEVTGEVILLSLKPRDVRYFDSDTASCLANLVHLTQLDKAAIDYSLNEVDAFNAQSQLRRLLHFVKQEKPYFLPLMRADDLQSVICVKGKRSNTRILFQSGAFLLFGDNAKLPESGNERIRIDRISVTNKRVILEELDLLNINESTVFPHIERSAHYIAKRTLQMHSRHEVDRFVAPNVDGGL